MDREIVHNGFTMIFLYFMLNFIPRAILALTEIISVTSGTSGYYQFPTCLEFLSYDITLKYFDPSLAKDCNLCDYTSNNDISDSTPRDVIITYSVKQTMNVALLQRTLRTVKSNASLVIMLDQEALNSIDDVTKQFFKNCSTQVILSPPLPFNSWDQSVKNFMMPLMYLFLKMNRHLINRVMFVDLFDVVFQRDPFSSHYIRKGELHMTRELVTNRNHVGQLRWPQCYFPDFTWDDLDRCQYNSGYFAGYIDEVLTFLNVFCQYTKYNKCIDQGLVNIMYQRKMLDKYGVKFADVFPDEWILHVYNLHLDHGFPRFQGMYWSNVTASIVHLYYHGNIHLFRSILNHCPRPSKTMTNYLCRRGDIDQLEESLLTWKQDSVHEYFYN